MIEPLNIETILARRIRVRDGESVEETTLGGFIDANYVPLKGELRATPADYLADVAEVERLCALEVGDGLAIKQSTAVVERVA